MTGRSSATRAATRPRTLLTASQETSRRSARPPSKEVEATGQKVARTLPKEAEKALNEALEQLQKVATKQLLNQIIDLAESAAPNRLAEIPIIPCTPFTPGLGLAIDLKESIGTLQKYYNKPPKGKQGYLRMARDLAGDQDAIILLPAGNGKIYIPVEFIDRQIDKLTS